MDCSTPSFPGLHYLPESLITLPPNPSRSLDLLNMSSPFPLLVQFSRSVMSDSLWPHGLQHAGLPCPLPTLEACTNSCLLSQGCHPTVLSSVVPFSSCPQSFLALGSFQMSFSFNISPTNEHSWLTSFTMDWLDLLAVQGTLKSLLQHHSSKVSVLQHSAFFTVQLSHPYMTTGKTIALTRRTFVGKGSTCTLFSLYSKSMKIRLFPIYIFHINFTISLTSLKKILLVFWLVLLRICRLIFKSVCIHTYGIDYIASMHTHMTIHD